MRTTRFYLATLKEAPQEAELASHQLMLRAGIIRRLGSGLYTWMPLGLRVLQKVEQVVREEMNRAGALEMRAPPVQPAELWQETGRWELYGPMMLRIKDRAGREFCYAPTAEEVLCDIIRKEVKSYRQLPVNLYQIQTKFRDEIRPRFGVMRAREFSMKDAYSFDADYAGLEKSYQAMYDAYTRIFTRLGLKFRAVAADTGEIGGTGSHEFQVLAAAGEDAIAFCPDSQYAANVELAEAISPGARPAASQAMQKVATPGKHTCEEVSEFLEIPIEKTVKSIVVMHSEALGSEKAADEMFMLLVRGDHMLNEIKATKVPGLKPFRFATEAEIRANLQASPGSLGPVGKPVKIIADRTVAAMSDWCCGANEDGFHITGVNFGRDLPEPFAVADIRNVVAGDPSPDGKGKLEIARGIEVGHVFQLRTAYTVKMGVTFIDEKSETKPMEMGCYGIGVTRVVAAAIEQNHDEKGIIWPDPMAPFIVAVVPLGYRKSEGVRAAADKLYAELEAAGIEVLLDDRDERPGVLLADQELIGIPHRFVIGERGLKEGVVEYQHRRDAAPTKVNFGEAAAFLQAKLAPR